MTDSRDPARPKPLPEPIPVTGDGYRWLSWLSPVTKAGQEMLADFGDRCASFLIDAAFFLLLLRALAAVADRADLHPAAHSVLIGVLVLVYSPLCTARWGGSPGKLLRGARVADVPKGENLPYPRALGRHLTHWVLACVPILNWVNYLFPLWDKPLRQCLHDKAVGTVVVIRL
ncbi:RDD family protein [Streptomyces sp. DSM 44915]|uniref:RDD family protein n=1 Tax=Streptomyces chisholmiae TaxID=3075540 RepID=A0ABU2JWH7_9ACTN|nr:RDD family protein [Streptomyces sp. DSM 44915]MDT0269098.1 RDD family protein [Streptomyces sp. DSM 44915]